MDVEGDGENSARHARLEYDNASHRQAGWFVRLSARLSQGVRKVQAQIGPYARAWEQANAATLSAAGPLWVVLGDSMSQGIGASRYDCGWVSQLQLLLDQAGHPYRVLNLSVYGARVEDVLTRQLPAMQDLAAEPDLVTVLIGSNDLVSTKHRRDLLSNYRRLLHQLPRGSVIASPFGNFGVGRQINALIAEQSADRGFKVLNNREEASFASWRDKLAEDHFHPSDRGYAELAESFFHTILPASALSGQIEPAARRSGHD
jgi:lysophospholipase L1-like esterase